MSLAIAGDQSFVKLPVRVHKDGNGKIVMGFVNFLNDFGIEGFRDNNSPVAVPLVDQILLLASDQRPEDIAGSEMQPEGMTAGPLAHGRHVPLGQADIGSLPLTCCNALKR